MLVAAAVGLLAAAVGRARGGSFENLAAVRFRWAAVLFAGLAIQIGFDLWSPEWLDANTALAALLISNLAVAVFLAANWKLAGIPLAAIGMALNVVVIAANGAMPVSERAAEIAGSPFVAQRAGIKHEALADETTLAWLGDVIPIPWLGVFSIGDMLLAAGVGVLVYSGMTRPYSPH